VSKKFGEWYQKTNKTEDTNKLTLLAFKIIIILHNTRLAAFIKASGNCQQRPRYESIAEQLSHVHGLLPYPASQIVWLNWTGHFSPIISPLLIDVSHAVWRGAPLEMNGGTKTGVRIQRPQRLKCDRRGSCRPHKLIDLFIVLPRNPYTGVIQWI
jgi:hypothetical protein